MLGVDYVITFMQSDDHKKLKWITVAKCHIIT